jgi:antitoxin MazE
MHTILRKIGNSSAVIIPKPFLAHLGAKVGDAIDLSFEKDHIILSYAKAHPRAGWDEAAKAIAGSNEDGLVWTEFNNTDDDTFKW